MDLGRQSSERSQRPGPRPRAASPARPVASLSGLSGSFPSEPRSCPERDEHIDFDHTVAQWRHLLWGWLAVVAQGPTDFPDRDYGGATIWGSSEYDDEEIPYQPSQSGHRRWPQRLLVWAWSHALEHASAGDPPPLARALMTTATRAAGTANWRVAIIDEATATEVALTAGLAALSATLQSPADKKRIAKTRMLGPLLGLASELGMSLPPKINEDLKDRRNDVVHQGADMTGAHAKATIEAAWAVVRAYDPLPACWREPQVAAERLIAEKRKRHLVVSKPSGVAFGGS